MRSYRSVAAYGGGAVRRRRRCADAGSGGVRAACDVACALCAGEEKKKKARMNAKGGNSALSLLFMGDLGRSWARDLLRTIS